MLANLSVDQALMKAKSHANRGEIEEAQKIYQSVFQSFSKIFCFRLKKGK